MSHCTGFVVDKSQLLNNVGTLTRTLRTGFIYSAVKNIQPSTDFFSFCGYFALFQIFKQNLTKQRQPEQIQNRSLKY